ncbi:uncharacterized protein [Leptinotarsa decemlineata]|uniref:uncharacterized protein n=1 Tax=Leptinotarsa decemlineata TaxID=7539 RepID=UPI003D3093E2
MFTRISESSAFAKRLIPQLWTCGIGWDEQLPQDIHNAWTIFKFDLPVSEISVPRYLFQPSVTNCTLHGFSDASEKGYSAVIYSRTEKDGIVHVRLVCAEAKVSSLKTIPIPRLELCEAVLFSDLFAFVKYSFDQDSSTALDWIRPPPYRWQTFESNRVSHIQERLSPDV